MFKLEDYNKSDNELARKLAYGSETALSILFSRYYEDLFLYGLKIAGKRAQVEDAIQDIFVALWQNRSGLPEIQSLRAYLYSSLRRRILRIQTTEQQLARRNQTYAGELPEFVISHEELLIAEQVSHEQKQMLRKTLQRLSERHREAVYLRFYQGLKYSEIAEVMGVKNQTVRNYVFEALQALREDFLPSLNSR